MKRKWTKVATTALLALVLAVVVGVGAVSFGAKTVYAAGKYETFMTSPTDNGLRMWTHEMSDFDPFTKEMQTASGAKISANNIAMGQFTMPGDTAPSQFNDYLFEYTMNSSGFSKNAHGNYAPQTHYDDQTGANKKPRSYSYMMADDTSDATVVFGSAEETFGYFELYGYVDVEVQHLAVEDFKSVLKFAVSDDNSNYTDIAADKINVDTLETLYMKKGGSTDGELEPIAAANEQIPDSKKGVTKVRFANNEFLNKKYLRITIDAEAVKAAAVAKSENRAENKPAKEFILIDSLSFFKNASVMNLSANTNLNSAWRSDQYGGGNLDLAKDNSTAGRVAAENFVYDNQKWAGATAVPTAYFVAHGAKPTAPDASQIFRVERAVKAFQVEVIMPSTPNADLSECVKIYCADNNDTDTQWQELAYRQIKCGNNPAGIGMTLLNTSEEISLSARYFKVTMTPGDGNAMKAWEPMYNQARVFENINYDVAISGDKIMAKTDSVQLTATMSPNVGPAANFTWAIVTDKTTAAGAAVTANGIVTATGNGMITVSATANGVTTEHAITVGSSVDAVTMKVEEPAVGTLYQGHEIEISATYRPIVELENYEFTSAVSGVAITKLTEKHDTVNGKVFAKVIVPNGEEVIDVPITVTFTADGEQKSAELTLKDVTPVVAVESVDITTSEMYVGLPANVVFTYAPNDATLAMPEAGMTKFEIVGEGTTADAELDKFGVLTATTVGTVKVKVTVDGTEAVKEITVKPFAMSGEAKKIYDVEEAGVTANASAAYGLVAVDGSFIVDKVNNPESRALKLPNRTDRSTLTFYDENGFNAFKFRVTILDDGIDGQRGEVSRIAAYRNKMNNTTTCLISYSSDGIEYYPVSWAALLDENFQMKNEFAWPVFDIFNEKPIPDNAKYLKVSFKAIRVEYEFMPLWHDGCDGTMMFYRTAVTENQELTVEGRTQLTAGVTAKYTVGDYVNYKASDITWSVTENGVATVDASITSDGKFTATKAGEYAITATITEGDATASGTLNVTVEKPVASEITVSGKDSYVNGDNFALTIKVLDQFGVEYVPSNLSYTILQATKGEGSADFTAVTGNGLAVNSAVQLDYFGTLTLTVSVDEQTATKTLTVRKASQVASVTIDAVEEMDKGGKVTLKATVKDQFGNDMTAAELAQSIWQITGTGYSKQGNGLEYTLDLTGSDFTGKLTVSFKTRTDELFDYTVKNFEINVKDTGAGSEDTGCGCGSVSATSALLGAIATLALAVVLVGVRKRKHS